MTTRNCDNCSVAYGPDDLFCENCGYDFVTGSLPTEADGVVPGPSIVAPSAAALAEAPSVLEQSRSAGSGAGGDGGSPQAATPAGAGRPAPGTDSETSGADQSASASGNSTSFPDVPRIMVTVSVDRDFFDEVVNDGEIDFPDPVPADQELSLAGQEFHIGRTSESRAIHPDIDVAALTNDQAVSSRHAVLRVADDGTLTIVDVGSTNGTFLDGVDSEAITDGVPHELKPGIAVYVGAWTRLVVSDQPS